MHQFLASILQVFSRHGIDELALNDELLKKANQVLESLSDEEKAWLQERSHLIDFDTVEPENNCSNNEVSNNENGHLGRRHGDTGEGEESGQARGEDIHDEGCGTVRRSFSLREPIRNPPMSESDVAGANNSSGKGQPTAPAMNRSNSYEMLMGKNLVQPNNLSNLNFNHFQSQANSRWVASRRPTSSDNDEEPLPNHSSQDKIATCQTKTEVNEQSKKDTEFVAKHKTSCRVHGQSRRDIPNELRKLVDMANAIFGIDGK